VAGGLPRDSGQAEATPERCAGRTINPPDRLDHADSAGRNSVLHGNALDLGGCRARNDDSALCFAEEKRARRNAAPRREVHGRGKRLLAVRHRAFGQRYSEPAFAAIVGRRDDARADRREQRVNELSLGLKVAVRRRAGGDAVNARQVFGSSEFGRGLAE